MKFVKFVGKRPFYTVLMKTFLKKIPFFSFFLLNFEVKLFRKKITMNTEIKDYINARLALLRLEVAEKTAKATSAMVKLIVFGSLAFMVVLFCNIAIGWYLGQELKNNALGFGLVGAFYFVLLFFLMVFKRSLLERPVMNGVIKSFFAKKHEE